MHFHLLEMNGKYKVQMAKIVTLKFVYHLHVLSSNCFNDE